MFGLTSLEPRAGLHPLVALGLAVVCLSFGLAVRPLIPMAVYVSALTALVLVLGYGRPWVRVHKFLLPAGSILGLITWLITGAVLSGVEVLLRFLLLGLTTCLVAVLDPADLARSLNRMHCPRNVSLGFLITVRFIPVLKTEMERIIEAVRARGLNLSWRNWRQGYRVLLVPLVVRLVHISDTLALSLETRGFSAAASPTLYRTPGFTWRDPAAVAGALVLMGGICGWMLR